MKSKTTRFKCQGRLSIRAYIAHRHFNVITLTTSRNLYQQGTISCDLILL